MASAKLDLMEFEEAVKCMGPFELKDYLEKTLTFLNKNNNESCFPNISSHVEAFLVGLALDTRNLKCKLFNADCKKLASEIIEVLELNKDVFRWSYAYENGSFNKNLLMYKKIFSNKLKMKPAKSKKSVSLISQRLILSQTEDPTPQFDIPTGCKIQLLNTTLRFLKNDSETVLCYPDMPLTHAQYMCTLVNGPKSDLNVGFGFKSLYAPLFEALDVCGLEYEFKISFAENGDNASLKLEKIRKTQIFKEENVRQANSSKSFEKNSSRSEPTLETNFKESNSSLNTSISSSASSTRSRRRRRPRPLPDGVSAGFVSDTLEALVAFTGDGGRATFTLDRLSAEEAAFVKGVKTLAGSPSKHGSFEPSSQKALKELNTNIAKVIETCSIKIEEGQTKNKGRYITLKKVPKEAAPKKIPCVVNLPTKSRGFAAKDSKSKDNLIQFESAGKLDPSKGEILTTDNTESTTDNAQGGARPKDNLNKRQSKLLEAMSVPVESDKGKRMMEMMGWAGGALGARADGILEPILPAIELAAGAGLGHVRPPEPAARPAAFRLALLHGLRGLLRHAAPSKLLHHKLPLTKKDKKFVSTALTSLNKRKAPPVGVKEEQEMAALLLRDMALLPAGVELKADISQDLRKITLTKFKNTQKFPMKLKLSKLKDPAPSAMTVLNRMNCDIIDDAAIAEVMATLTHTTCRTPVAIRGRAVRLLFLQRYIDFVQGKGMEREFRFAGSMPKKMIDFLENVVSCINRRTRCSYVADEEMGLYDELLRIAANRDCYLDIDINSPAKFVLRKMIDRAAQESIANSDCPKPTQDNNNNNQQTKSAEINKIINQNQAKNGIRSNNDNPVQDKEHNYTSDLNDAPVSKVNNHGANGFDHIDEEKCADNTKIETQCDNHVNRLVPNDSFKVKEDKTLAKSNVKSVNGVVQNGSLQVAKINECDIKVKDNVINSLTIDKDIVKQETETDNDADSSWSTCSDHGVDISEFDKEIEELDTTLSGVGLGFNVRDSDASVSPTSDSEHNKLKVEKPKENSKNKVVAITLDNLEAETHAEIFKRLQTAIWNQIDGEETAIPLLKCHGVQNGSLVYSCLDAKDVVWLKKTIKAAKLNLKVRVFAKDFIIERKSRKMAVKINSFIPLDAEKLLSKIELYNDIDTRLWRVLACESFTSYVIFIIEVDELSFEYISEDNFSLYMGIDKAQFSIIF